MPYKVWMVPVENKRHEVELKWGNFWGSLRVKVDGLEVVKRDITFDTSFKPVNFGVVGVAATLVPHGWWFPKWELYVGGQLIQGP